MGNIRFKKLNIKVKIAFVYSLVALVIVILSALFLSIALRNSMKSRPVTSEITTKAYTVKTVTNDNKTIAMYETSPKDPSIRMQYSVSENQLNTFLSSEVFKRLVRYSAIAVSVILVVIFFLSYFLSKWLLKPLSNMAKTTQKISAQNLDLRLAIPEADDELKQLSNSFNQTLDGLQTSFIDLERLNAYVSHELKNALAVMKTRLEVDAKEGDCRQTVRFAVDQVDRITRTINDILALSFSHVKDSSEMVDMAMVAAQVVDEYSAAGRSIVLEIPEEGVLPVRGKEAWFQRVVANLLDNAVKHSEDDNPITVQVRQHYDAVIVSVADHGKGIPSEEQDTVWKPFITGAPSSRNGFGLGLAMVHHVMDLCGGLVWMDSDPKQGTVFYISLPLVKKSEQFA